MSSAHGIAATPRLERRNYSLEELCSVRLLQVIDYELDRESITRDGMTQAPTRIPMAPDAKMCCCDGYCDLRASPLSLFASTRPFFVRLFFAVFAF